MQYPIIDLITDAYINNGWTGLNLIVNQSNIIFAKIPNCNIDGTGVLAQSPQFDMYVFYSTDNVTYRSNLGLWVFGYFSKLPNIGDSSVDNRRYVISGNIISSSFTGYICTRAEIGQTPQIIEGGGPLPPYEPYAPPTTDIKNRLKLPLPHYFPHPVIDALQRAAAGTQTADDTEILRHYLTPLGIGGI